MTFLSSLNKKTLKDERFDDVQTTEHKEMELFFTDSISLLFDQAQNIFSWEIFSGEWAMPKKSGDIFWRRNAFECINCLIL